MIELRRISAGYANKNIISGISLNLPKGKIFSIIGRNGSGKSTLLKTAVGIIMPKSGEVLLDGKPAFDMTRQQIAKKIAYLAQGKSVSDMTARQLVLHGRFPHLRYPRRYTRKDCEIADAALAELGVSDLAERPLSSLSGGMRQNVYIAMALSQDTDYILLDEPTTYLDISHQLEVMKILRSLADSGKGIVAVMHDLPLAFSFSDSIAVLENGKIIAEGTPQHVCRDGVIKQVFGTELQFCAAENYYYYKYNIR